MPFDMCLASGKTIPVKHPDRVLFSENKTVAVVAEGEHLHIVDLDQVEHESPTDYEGSRSEQGAGQTGFALGRSAGQREHGRSTRHQ